MNLLLYFGLLCGYLISLTCADDRLLFVQAVWRNGDRTPLESLTSDAVNDWPVPLGELTELGMRQHVNLGQVLRDSYVGKNLNLSLSYKSNEIYIRSTDVNRTMISATANLIGMYPGSTNDIGHSYPNISTWPEGFIPIAIHTLPNYYDYTLNPDRICKRFDDLKNLIQETPEYQKLENENKKFLEDLSKKLKVTIELSNISKIADIISVEKIWNKTVAVDDETYGQIISLNNILESWENGFNLKPLNNIDFSIEIPKIRGGSLLWSIIGNMQLKRACTRNPNSDYCPFFNKLKYYAYSAHDTTIAALFSTLKLNHTNWNEDGYPQYSSCVTIELWQKADGGDYIKFLYYTLDPEDNENHLSPQILVIPDCKIATNKTMCSLDDFAGRFDRYNPKPDAATLCATELGKDPEVPTTTVKPKDNSANAISVLSFIPLIFAFGFLNN